MRTTRTLDDDVFLLLGRRQSESGGTFKDLVNGLLRMAFATRDALARKPAVRHFSTKVFRGRKTTLGTIASTHDMLALAEGEDYR